METQEQEKVKYVIISEGGWTGYFNKSHRVSHYGNSYKKYCEDGTPIIDTRTIPDDKKIRWALQSPLVDPELEGFNDTEVSSYPNDLLEHPEAWKLSMLPKQAVAFALVSNSRYVSVEQFIKLAEEWGATVTYYAGE